MGKKAAESGFPAAQHNLAIAYYEGEGVFKNEGLAMKWLKVAAKNGYPLAIELLNDVE